MILTISNFIKKKQQLYIKSTKGDWSNILIKIDLNSFFKNIKKTTILDLYYKRD